MSVGHQFRLVDIGRLRHNGIVAAITPDDLVTAVLKHLRSSDVSITADGVVMAGFRRVGSVEPIGELATAQFKRWCAEG